MNLVSPLTFNDKLAIFEMSAKAEYEGSLACGGIIALEKLFDSCSVHEQEDLKDVAYIVCDLILEKKYQEDLPEAIENGTAFQE